MRYRMALSWIQSTQHNLWQTKVIPGSGKGTSPNITLTDESFQTIEGFGGCFNELGWDALSMLDETSQAKIFDSLFDNQKGCGFSFCRLPIGASDYALEWYSHNEQDGDILMHHFTIERDRLYLIPYIQKALSYQPTMTLFASPWSPPTWMKYPKAYNYGTLIQTPENLHAYARYLLKFVEAYQAERIPIQHIHVQNEPCADQKFPSCVWSGETLKVFIRDYMGPLFKQAGYPAEIWLGTLNTDQYDEYVLDILVDEEARNHISGVGYQWAGKGAIQRHQQAFPHIPFIQTENECGNGENSWSYAHYVFRLIHHYLINGATAYVYWNMILKAGGESTWGWKQNSMISIEPQTKKIAFNPEFFVMKHVAAFVQPKAIRLGITGNWAGNAVGFKNPDGSLVVVAANPLNHNQHITLAMADFIVDLEMEAESFHTFVGKSG